MVFRIDLGARLQQILTHLACKSQQHDRQHRQHLNVFLETELCVPGHPPLEYFDERRCKTKHIHLLDRADDQRVAQAIKRRS